MYQIKLFVGSAFSGCEKNTQITTDKILQDVKMRYNCDSFKLMFNVVILALLSLPGNAMQNVN